MASDRLKSYAGKPAPRVFETDDLAILTGWAQAVLEALAYAPDRIEPWFAAARPGAPWRAVFQIAEPSAQLAEAISFMDLAIRAVTSLDSASRIDALRVLCAEDRSGEDAVEKLVRRVLQSTLYQLSTPCPRSVRSPMKPSRSPATRNTLPPPDSDSRKERNQNWNVCQGLR